MGTSAARCAFFTCPLPNLSRVDAGKGTASVCPAFVKKPLEIRSHSKKPCWPRRSYRATRRTRFRRDWHVYRRGKWGHGGHRRAVQRHFLNQCRCTLEGVEDPSRLFFWTFSKSSYHCSFQHVCFHGCAGLCLHQVSFSLTALPLTAFHALISVEVGVSLFRRFRAPTSSHF